MLSRFISHPYRLLTLATASAAALALLAHSAFAVGIPSEQIALNMSYSNCPMYGPAADVTIIGYNQNNVHAIWGPYRRPFPNGAYVRGWWWQGLVTVVWRDVQNGRHYQTTAWIPPSHDPSFETSPTIVTVDCHGSLRKVSTHVTVQGNGGEVWACGGWRDGGSVTDTIFFAGYDEYRSQYQFTYGIAGNGVAPAIVTSRLTVPNC